jgi:hypothetical protein
MTGEVDTRHGPQSILELVRVSVRKRRLDHSAATIIAGRLLAKDFGFFGGEFLFGEDALGFEFAELFELAEAVGGRGCRGRRGRGRGRVLLLVLFRPAVVLASADAVRHGGRGTGDRGGPSDPS